MSTRRAAKAMPRERAAAAQASTQRSASAASPWWTCSAIARAAAFGERRDGGVEQDHRVAPAGERDRDRRGIGRQRVRPRSDGGGDAARPAVSPG